MARKAGTKLNNGTVVRTVDDIRDAVHTNDARIIDTLRADGAFTDADIAKEIDARAQWFEHNVKATCQHAGIRYQKPQQGDQR